jgi:hypothetical protein
MAIVPHSVLRHTLSGRSFGDGYPQTQWYFDYLPSADYNTLMNYISGVQSGYVYIKTRLEDGTYGTYRAIMHRPETRNEKEAESYGWRRITIKFTRLEAVT